MSETKERITRLEKKVQFLEDYYRDNVSHSHDYHFAYPEALHHYNTINYQKLFNLILQHLGLSLRKITESVELVKETKK